MTLGRTVPVNNSRFAGRGGPRERAAGAPGSTPAPLGGLASGRGPTGTRGGPDTVGGTAAGTPRPGGFPGCDGPASGPGVGVPGRRGGSWTEGGARFGARVGGAGAAPEVAQGRDQRPGSRSDRRRARAEQGSPRCPMRVRKASPGTLPAPAGASRGRACRSATVATPAGPSWAPSGAGSCRAVRSGPGSGPASPLPAGPPAWVEGPDGTSGAAGGPAWTGPSAPRVSSIGRVRWNEGRVASVTSWVLASIVTSEVTTSPSTTGALRRGSTTGSPTAVGSRGM